MNNNNNNTSPISDIQSSHGSTSADETELVHKKTSADKSEQQRKGSETVHLFSVLAAAPTRVESAASN